MSRNWPLVPLGALVRDITESRSFTVQSDDLIVDPTIQSATHTIVTAKVSRGFEVKVRTRLRIEPGDLVFSRLHTQNGAFAFSNERFQATTTFVPLTIHEEEVDRRFLYWALHKFVPTLAASDTVGRETYKTNDILRLRLPLPSMEIQRRVAAMIANAAEQVDEVRRLRELARKEAKALLASHLGARFAGLARSHPVMELRELTTFILDGPHVTPSYLPADGGGVPFVTVKNMVTGKLDFSDLNFVSEDDHRQFSRRCKAERGDVLYSKDGATRGRPCLIDTDREFSYFVSVALIKPLREKLDGRYLVHLLNSTFIKDRMAEKSRGDMIPHIVLREIRAFPVPVLDLRDQQRVAMELDAVQAEIDRLSRLQAETSIELDALLPALLDRAFKGELV